MEQRVLVEMIERVYSVLDRPEDISAVGDELGRILGSDAGDIVTEKRDGSSLRSWSSHGFDPEFLQSYDESYLGRNAWFDWLRSQPRGRAHVDLEAGSAYRNSAYVQEWVRGQNLGDTLGAVVDETAGEHTWIGFSREIGSPAWSGRETALLDGLMPHLRRVMSACLAGMVREPGLSLLDSASMPVFLVEADRRIAQANAPGMAALSRGDIAVQDPSGRLVLRDPQAARGLEAGLKTALSLATGRPPTSPLVVRSGGVPVAVAQIMPMFHRDRLMAAVALRRLGERQGLDIALAVEAFELTETEAALAEWLAGGGSIPDFARRRGVTRETARWHLKNLETKTGTNRIEQLVALLHRVCRPMFGDD